MLSFLRKKDRNVYAPVKGTMIELEQVPDKVFAEKLLGDGVAFYPEEDFVYAPCDGKITMIADTKHAVGIQADNGAEILIHIGLETVELNGEGFKISVKVDDIVKKGEVLAQVDLEFLKSKNINTVTPMVITNEKTICREEPICGEEPKDVEVGNCVFQIQ